MPEFTDHQAGTFSYAELVSTDPAASGNFYTQLFGWKRNDQDMGEYGIYTQFTLKERVVAAQYQLTDEQKEQGTPPNWGQYVTVEDIDASTARAGELGGTVLAGPMDVMNHGRMAVVSDDLGAVFCLWQAKDSCGVELRDEPGSMCWNELMTTDAEKSSAFYGGMFGWKVQSMEMGQMGTYSMFMRGPEQWSAGMLEIQPEMGPMLPNWLVYFAVSDTDAAFTSAAELGGKPIVPPTDIPGSGRFAVICDPVGAVFGIFQPKEQG